MSITIGIDASRANRIERTGVEWYAFHIIQELKGVIPAEHKVLLYTEEPLRNGLDALPPNWENKVLGWPPRRLWTQVRLSWEMLVRPPDVLFVPAHVVPVVMPKRTVTTLHDAAFMVKPEAYGRAGRNYLRLMYKIALRRARVLTVSEFSKRELVRLFRADPGRIDVTHLGYDAHRYRPVEWEDELREKLAAYGITRPYFLFVGRLETKKNIAGILKAFKRYKEHLGDGARLVLVGKRGRGYDKELAELGESAAKVSVMQQGYVAPEDMRYFYAGAVALVFPSWYEGFGLPVLEAMACGTPVIASNVTSIPEVGGEAVLYVDPADHLSIADAMERVTKDQELRDRLVRDGFERVKGFSWRRTAELTWEAIENAAK